MSKKVRVIVEVSGGVVVGTYSNDSEIVVDILDHDNLEDLDPDNPQDAETIKRAEELEAMIDNSMFAM